MSVFIRVLLRYASGILIAKGLLPDDLGQELSTDPEIINALEIGAGLLAGAAAEVWMWLSTRAKKVIDDFQGENV